MSFYWSIMVFSVVAPVCFAGVIEERQNAETFVTCTPAYNPRFCPNPYCVCTQSATVTVSGTTTTNSIVNVYSATSGVIVCPTGGVAVSEAGCQIVVLSKTDSTCGNAVFNTEFCQPPTTLSTSSNFIPTQVSTVSQVPVKGAPAGPLVTPVITPGPSYTILSGSTCVSDGSTLSPTLSPQQTCGSLTAPANCIPFAVLPYNTFNPQSASFTGCTCADSWQMPALTSLQIAQGAQRQCNPSYYSSGPWAEVASVTNRPGFYDIVPKCENWLANNTINPTPGDNPCSGFPFAATYTASCSYVQQADALGQADSECIYSNKSPKYMTQWFGECGSTSDVTYTAKTTIG